MGPGNSSNARGLKRKYFPRFGEKLQSQNEIKDNDDAKLDLFSIRAVQEIQKRLGEDCLTEKDHPNYYDALFMTLWNKINKSYWDGNKGHANKIGLKLRDMIKAWRQNYESSIADVRYKFIILFSFTERYF